VDIPIPEQLEAYTTWKTRELLARHGIATDQYGVFTSDHRDLHTLFTFTREQLVDYLRAHPERATACLEQSQQLRGIYDKDVLEREGERYVLYWQDHSSRRNEKFYDDLSEAAADWLVVQHGMWLA
jgi:hypothetical protein